MLDALLVALTALACFGFALAWLGGPGARGLAPVLAARRQPRTELSAAGLVLLLCLVCWWASARVPPAWVHFIAGFAALLLGLRCLTAAITLASIARPSTAPRTDAPHNAARSGEISAGGRPAGPERLASAGRPAARVRPTPSDVPATAPHLAGSGGFLHALPPWLAVGTLVTAAGLAAGLPAASLAGALATLLAAFVLLLDLPDRWSRGIRAAGVRMLASLLVTTLGTLWAGAAIGIGWPGGGATILALFLGFSVVAAGGVEIARQWRLGTQAARRAGGDG